MKIKGLFAFFSSYRTKNLNKLDQYNSYQRKGAAKLMKKSTLLKYVSYGTLLSALPFSQLATAAEADVSFSGFASFYYGKALSDADEGGTTEGLGQEGEYRDFNKLGLRMDVDLEEKLSFTAQAIAKGKNDYDLEFDWINATFAITPDLTVSVGRMRLPIFMYSDYIDVGYAYQWVAPPHSVYGVPSFTAYEGANIRWVADMGGDWTSDLVVYAGNIEEEEENVGTTLTFEDGAGFTWSVDREWLTLRMSLLFRDCQCRHFRSLSSLYFLRSA